MQKEVIRKYDPDYCFGDGFITVRPSEDTLLDLAVNEILARLKSPLRVRVATMEEGVIWKGLTTVRGAAKNPRIDIDIDHPEY